MKKRVLYIAHSHPKLQPGGAEQYALDLYEAMKNSGVFEPILVARTGPPWAQGHHPGTLFSVIDEDPNQYFFFTSGYDHFLGVPHHSKEAHTHHFRSFLLAFRPDVVHFQHTTDIGYDLIREVRNTLPQAAIIYTLHEYLPICFREGQLVRTTDGSRCLDPSPRRCSECFPGITPQAFFMRKRFIQAHFSLVDQFLAPSRFLMERYLDWGVPPDKICFEENGRPPVTDKGNEPGRAVRNRFAFFGQVTPFKGVTVLLKAMRILSEQGSHDALSPDCKPKLWMYAAKLQMQPRELRDEIQELLSADGVRESVSWMGRYEAADLREHMQAIDWVVVPSIWWENSPLVIQEAFAHARPVICSGIGGMAEKVAHGISGLHFRVNDPYSLASVMREATSTEGLWSRLKEGIPHAYSIEASAARLSALYESVLGKRAA